MVAGASVAAANAAAVGQVLSAKYNMIGQIGSGLIGGASNIASSFLSYGQQKKLAEHIAKLNYEYAEKSARNQPTWNRAGLESAGYNPMLAVLNSTSGANSSWTSAQSANAPDISGGISSGIANAQSFQRLKNETQQAESVSDANYANADKAKAEKAEISARLPFVPKRQRAEIAKLEADAQLAEATKHNLKERLELDRYINDSGLATTRRGQDISYNATTYGSKIKNPFNAGLYHIYKSGSGSAGKTRDGRTARDIVGW